MLILAHYTPLVGACLRQTMPHVTSQRVEEITGAKVVDDFSPTAKYSKAILVRLSGSHHVCSLYMCYGEWRIGARPETPESVIEQIYSELEPSCVGEQYA